MSSIPVNSLLINQNKENAIKSTKPLLAGSQSKQLGQNENTSFPNKKSLIRAPSSHLTLTKGSSKNALRTKSANSIAFQPTFKNQQQAQHLSQQQQLPQQQISIGGNFNKIRKISTLNDINSLSTSETPSDDQVGAKKFRVQRDSPLSQDVNPRRRLKFDNMLGQQLFDELRNEARTEEESEDEIEFVPIKQDELPYIPDEMQSLPKQVLEDVFVNPTSRLSKESEEFKDPLELDLSSFEVSKESNEFNLEIDLGHDDSIDGLGSDLELEFPEFGEESEAKKLEKLLEFYEYSTKFKTSTL